MPSALAAAKEARERCPECGRRVVLPCKPCSDDRIRRAGNELLPLAEAHRRATGDEPPASLNLARAVHAGLYGAKLPAASFGGELCTTVHAMAAFLLSVDRGRQTAASESTAADPTPAEIAERAAAIRATWSPEERARRAGWATEAGHVAASEIAPTDDPAGVT